MKNRIINTLESLTVVTIFTANMIFAQGIAARYPGDKNIELDSNVIFTEMAEESTVADVVARWSSITKNGNPISLDASTSPPNSPGKQSLRFSTVAGTTPSADLYKLLVPDYNDSLFFRCYIRYNTYGTFHHSGLRIGGTYPASPFPANFAGRRPNDSTNQFFYLGAEATGAPQKSTANSTYDFYNYWRRLRHSSFFPDTVFYGNSFINSNAVSINTSQWNCIEVRIKLNIPPDSSGEISMWINGILVSTVKSGTTGSWIDDDFFPGSGAPFEGFSWRGNERLKLNFIWLTHFVDHDTIGLVNSINYDHIVLAKRYIGPITAPTEVLQIINLPLRYVLEQNYPNPFNPSTTIAFQVPTRDGVNLQIYDALGRRVTTLVNSTIDVGRHEVFWDASDATSGVYFYTMQSGSFIQTKKLLLLR